MGGSLLPFAIGLALVVPGLLLLNSSLIAAAIPLVLFAIVRALGDAQAAAPKLLLHRSFSRSRCVEGDEIDIELAITNSGMSAPLVSLVDRLPQELTLIEGRNRYLGRLSPHEVETLRYTVTAGRGHPQYDTVRIRSWSPWTLTMSESHQPLSGKLVVHPRIEPLDTIAIRPRRTRAFAGPVKANLGGQGLDFFGCRAYTPGDDIRRINWRAYARHGSLIINEFELERIADVNIILDARAKSHTQLDGETTFDHSVRAAASLASHFLDQGNNVGLLIYGDYVHWVFPGIGNLKKERILDRLANAKLSDKAAFQELRSMPTRLLPPRSQLVLVSPLVDEDDIEVVALLVDRGYSVLLVCPHSSALIDARGLSEGDRTVQLARRILDLKRELFLGSLAGVGTSVIDWNVTVPLRTACRGIHHAHVRRYRT